MALSQSSPYGRGCKIPLPPDYSLKSRMDDYCAKTRNKTNIMAWLDRQSKNIAAAFNEPCRPRMSKVQPNGNADSSVEVKGAVMYGKDKDAILKFTTLMDTEAEELNANRRSPRTAGINKSVADGAYERDTMATDTNDGTIDLLLEPPKLAEAHTKEEELRQQIWKINSHGHLIVSRSLSAQLAGRQSTSLNPLRLEQSAAVASLAEENRQLDAFKQALRFALDDALAYTQGIKFTIEIGLQDSTPGKAHPIIDIVMEQWREDTELQCCLAYYLLRGMLKRYGNMPFPDKVDIQEFSAEQGRRLLVPYNAGRDRTDGQGESVRCRIVGEMRRAGNGSQRL
ncbi:hypothetical protein F5Y03DRAFT_405561 [Xylaria venustula]|nr:hypothetical protein F5Y03DRAFT_405561 [Xylaria venustula]